MRNIQSETIYKLQVKYPQFDKKKAIEYSRIIKDEMEQYKQEVLYQYLGLTNLTDDDKIIWSSVIDVLGYVGASFLTYYDLCKEVNGQKLIHFLVENESKVLEVEQKLRNRQRDLQSLGRVLTGPVDDVWQYAFHRFANSRTVQVEPDNTEIDHWAVITMRPNKSFYAANSIFNFPTAEQAFLETRSTAGNMHVDFHDLAHYLDILFQGPIKPQSLKVKEKIGLFNTPSDLEHIMSADDPKSSFFLFLGMSQQVFDQYLEINNIDDEEIRPELTVNLLLHISHQIRKYLLGEIEIEAKNSSFYPISPGKYRINSQNHIKIRELALIGEANLGEGRVVWLEQYIFIRGLNPNLSVIDKAKSIYNQGPLSYKQWRVIIRQMGIIEGILQAVQFLSSPGQRYAYGLENTLAKELIKRLITYRGSLSQDLFNEIGNKGQFETATRSGFQISAKPTKRQQNTSVRSFSTFDF